MVMMRGLGLLLFSLILPGDCFAVEKKKLPQSDKSS